MFYHHFLTHQPHASHASPADRNSTPNRQQPYHPSTPTPNAHPATATNAPDDDDEDNASIDLISLNLSQQGSLIHPSQESANPTPPKRKRPTPNYIQFYTKLTTDMPSVISTIVHQLDEQNLPGNCFNHNFYTGSLPHPSQMNQQIISIKISQAKHITSLLTIIGKLYPTSYPQRTTTPLTQPQPPSSISLTPIPPNTWAHYCQLTTCPFHNNGIPFVADTQDGCTIFQLHVQQLHAPAFLSLPHNQLTTIGWTRCCTECTHIFLIPTDLTLH
jgi:hypothetical protein